MVLGLTGSKNTQLGSSSTLLFTIIISLLPAAFFMSASLVAASRNREAGTKEIGTESQQTADRLKIEKELAQGRFLIADRRLTDPNFRETVVLLIRYGTEGAMGVVINRPVQIKLSEVIPDIKELKGSKKTLYLGGPVETNKMIFLMKSAKPPPESMKVFGDVYLSSNRDELRRLVKSTSAEENFRIFAGYAGWASGQLDAERGRGDWHVLDADAATLFDKKSSEIWQELIHRFTVKWVHLTMPDRSEFTGWRNEKCDTSYSDKADCGSQSYAWGQ